MGARGPKSGNELATIGPAGIVVTRRLDPPQDLTAEAAAMWREIVNEPRRSVLTRFRAASGTVVPAHDCGPAHRTMVGQAGGYGR